MQPRNRENTKPRNRFGFRVFVLSCFRGLPLIAVAASPALAQSAGKPVNFKGLEMSVASVERAASASLKDCPPGDNRVNAMTRPGEDPFAAHPHGRRVTMDKRLCRSVRRSAPDDWRGVATARHRHG